MAFDDLLVSGNISASGMTAEISYVDAGFSHVMGGAPGQ